MQQMSSSVCDGLGPWGSLSSAQLGRHGFAVPPPPLASPGEMSRAAGVQVWLILREGQSEIFPSPYS